MYRETTARARVIVGAVVIRAKLWAWLRTCSSLTPAPLTSPQARKPTPIVLPRKSRRDLYCEPLEGAHWLRHPGRAADSHGSLARPYLALDRPGYRSVDHPVLTFAKEET